MAEGRNEKGQTAAEVAAEVRIADHDKALVLAEGMIKRDRNETYGAPIDDFDTTARFWTVWLQARGLLPADQELVPEDVAFMMQMLKLSRESRVHLLDNIVDDAGYVGTAGMVIAERLRRGWGVAFARITASMRASRG